MRPWVAEKHPYYYIFTNLISYFYVNSKLGGFLGEYKTALSPLALVGVRLPDDLIR